MCEMTEDLLEQKTLGWLAEVGYTHLFDPDISPDGPDQERDDYGDAAKPCRWRSLSSQS